jgi:hypothetical protein
VGVRGGVGAVAVAVAVRIGYGPYWGFTDPRTPACGGGCGAVASVVARGGFWLHPRSQGGASAGGVCGAAFVSAAREWRRLIMNGRWDRSRGGSLSRDVCQTPCWKHDGTRMPAAALSAHARGRSMRTDRVGAPSSDRLGRAQSPGARRRGARPSLPGTSGEGFGGLGAT